MEVGQSLLEDNRASRASAVLCFNDDDTATYRVYNTTVRAGEGSTALMLGRVNVSEGVEWECRAPGSVYVQVRS